MVHSIDPWNKRIGAATRIARIARIARLPDARLAP
jgi:hypothetical protein